MPAPLENASLAIIFNPVELHRSEIPFQYALIAKFSPRRPRMESIRSHISANWGLEHAPIIGMIDSRNVFLKLQDADDYSIAWIRSSHEMEGAMFRLFKLSLDFSLQHESAIAPVWF